MAATSPTKPQQQVLRTLDRSNQPLPTHFKTTKKTVSGASADALAKKGLVRRNRDGRVEITAKGRKALAKAV